MRTRVKVVLDDVREKTKKVILELQKILLDERLEDHRTAWGQRYPDIIQEIVNRIHIIRAVKVVANHDLLDSDLLKPLVELLVC